MEFQLPYLALRTGRPVSDSRLLRQRHEMLKYNDSSGENMFYYEAQVAFLMTGYDEWHWTAYCCVDTFFGSEQTVTDYLRRQNDGPSGGAMELDRQIWNPRQYFLRVFSERLAQATREWRNITSALDDRLNSHVRASKISLRIFCLSSTGGLIQSKDQHRWFLWRPPSQPYEDIYPCRFNPQAMPWRALDNHRRLSGFCKHRIPVLPNWQRDSRQSLEGLHDKFIWQRRRFARNAEEARTTNFNLRPYAERAGRRISAQGESLHWCFDVRDSGEHLPHYS